MLRTKQKNNNKTFFKQKLSISLQVYQEGKKNKES